MPNSVVVIYRANHELRNVSFFLPEQASEFRQTLKMVQVVRVIYR